MDNNQKPVKYKIGDKVIARWADGKRYPGTVELVTNSGNYYVFFDDGAKKSVKHIHMEPNLNPSPNLNYPFADPKEVREVHESDLCDYIIQCACESNKDSGILIQCKCCLSWKHAVCLGIESDVDLPNAFTCSTCKSPRKVRDSCRFSYDHSWLNDGKLPYLPGSNESSHESKKIVAVNHLLDAAMECIYVIHGLKNKISLLEGTKNADCLKFWDKSWIKNETELNESQRLADSYTLFKKSKKRRSKRTSGSNSSKISSRLSNVDFDDESSRSSDFLGSCMSPKFKDGDMSPRSEDVSANFSEDSSKTIEMEISDSNSNEVLSIHDIVATSTPEEQKKNLSEHIYDIKSRLDMRLNYIESKITELEKFYDIDFDPDALLKEEARFRKKIKTLNKNLQLVKKPINHVEVKQTDKGSQSSNSKKNVSNQVNLELLK